MDRRFRVSALDADRRLVTLVVAAASEGDARAQVDSRGLKPIRAQAVATLPALGPRNQKFDLLLFTQELAALLGAGLSLPETMETLVEKEQRPASRELLLGIRNALYQGQPLSQALLARPEVFPELLVACVRSSEATGALDHALGRYIAYHEQIANLQKRLLGAALYPAMLMLAGALVCLFLLGYLVPKFSRIYDGMHGNLPFLSRWLLKFGGAIDGKQGIAVLLLAGTVAAVVYFAREPAMRHALVGWLGRSPALGARIRLFQLARFYRAAGMLQQGGTPLVGTLERAAELLAAEHRARATQAIAAVKQGLPLAEALQRAELTTPVAQRLLRVGEKTGRLGEMMERTAAFYDDELSRFVDTVTKLAEPLLMLFIGGFIGLIVVLMYLPIFELVGGQR